MKKTFFEKYALLILVILTFTLPIMGVGVKRTLENVRNNIKEWLPEGDSETQQHRWFQSNFPMEQFILMSWQDCTLHDPRLDVMKHRLLPRKNAKGETIREDWNLRFYDSLRSGGDLVKELQSQYSSMTQAEAVSRLKGSLIGEDGNQTGAILYLVSGSEGQNMKGAVGEIYRLARRDFVFKKSDLTPDQLKAVERILRNLPAEVVVEPNTFLERKMASFPVPQNLTEYERNRETIPPEDLIVLPGLQPSQLHLGGPPVDNIAIDVEGNRTLMRLAWMAAVVGFTIASLCLRSVRLVAVVFCAALFATGYALALVNFTGKETDAIMLSMPPLVYVLTMSSAIHFINYYHDALEEEGGVHGAPERAVKLALVPVLISATTTALGLFSLMTSNLGPIYNFGLYSALGVIISMCIVLLYVPSILQLFPSHRFADKLAAMDDGSGKKIERKDLIGAQWQKLGHFLIYHPWPVLIACSAIMFAGFAGIPQLKVSFKLMEFFCDDTSIIRDYTWLEENLGPLVPMEVVLKFDNQVNRETMIQRLRLVEEVAKAVEDHRLSKNIQKPTEADFPEGGGAKKFEEIGGILSAATVGPEIKSNSPTAMRTLNKKLEEGYSKLNEFVTYDLGGAEKWYEGKYGESPALKVLGIPEDLIQDLNEAKITNLRELREELPELIAAGKLTSDVVETIQKAVFQWQVDHCSELWRITIRVEALTDLDYGYFVDDLHKMIDPVVKEHAQEKDCKGVEVIYTGSVPLVYKTQHELMRSLTWSVILAFVTISVVMMVMLRSFVGGFVSMLPNIFPIAVVFGAMGWLQVRCDLGAMMTASVALGIATDDTIHYLTWYRRALDEGLHHHQAALSAYRRCATAMTQTTFISAFGLSVFAFSTFTPTLYFGIMMLVLMFMALFGDMIFLPSLLITSGGTMFSKGKKVEKD